MLLYQNSNISCCFVTANHKRFIEIAKITLHRVLHSALQNEQVGYCKKKKHFYLKNVCVCSLCADVIYVIHNSFISLTEFSSNIFNPGEIFYKIIFPNLISTYQSKAFNTLICNKHEFNQSYRTSFWSSQTRGISLLTAAGVKAWLYTIYTWSQEIYWNYRKISLAST